MGLFLSAFISNHSATRILIGRGIEFISVVKIWMLNKDQICVRSMRKDGSKFNKLLKRSLFLEDARITRESMANDLRVSTLRAYGDRPFVYEVRSMITGTQTVHLNPAIQKCNCDDYQYQAKIGNGFGKPVCSHLIAVAKHLGFGSFKEWSQNQLTALVN